MTVRTPCARRAAHPTHGVVETKHGPVREVNGVVPEFCHVVQEFNGVVEQFCYVVQEFYGMVFRFCHVVLGLEQRRYRGIGRLFAVIRP